MGIYTIKYTLTAMYEVDVEADTEDQARQAFEEDEFVDPPTVLEKLEAEITSIDRIEPEDEDANT
jgi:hypothetical protein